MDPIRKNPSRKECEDSIKRILMTEVLENGKNSHFKSAKDFMSYFESLYPPGDSLNKQVQRAIKSLDMPKDENGFFIINKTGAQMDEDREIGKMLRTTQATPMSLSECDTLFLKTDRKYKDYLVTLIEESETFRGKYVTIVNSTEGLIFYTENKTNLETLINSLI
ncbi:MAG: hypothetical protein K5644_05235 [Lachnospiraceae bacterium]|nr:hypothetical protein [Lachnospiraceae bacterium]